MSWTTRRRQPEDYSKCKRHIRNKCKPQQHLVEPTREEPNLPRGRPDNYYVLSERENVAVHGPILAMDARSLTSCCQCGKTWRYTAPPVRWIHGRSRLSERTSQQRFGIRDMQQKCEVDGDVGYFAFPCCEWLRLPAYWAQPRDWHTCELQQNKGG